MQRIEKICISLQQMPQMHAIVGKCLYFIPGSLNVSSQHSPVIGKIGAFRNTEAFWSCGYLESLKKKTKKNNLVWKKASRSSSPTLYLKMAPKCHIYACFKHLQGRGFRHFPGCPVPFPDDPRSEEYFP